MAENRYERGGDQESRVRNVYEPIPESPAPGKYGNNARTPVNQEAQNPMEFKVTGVGYVKSNEGVPRSPENV